MTRPMDVVGPVDAQNAPTSALQNAQSAFRTASTGRNGSFSLQERRTKGDTSISLRMGTFLFRVDTSAQARLTPRVEDETLWRLFEPELHHIVLR